MISIRPNRPVPPEQPVIVDPSAIRHEPILNIPGQDGGDSGDSRRVGVIDVGTNSIRLIVAESGGAGGYRVVDDEKITTRLGQDLHQDGELVQEAMERSAEAIARLREIADGHRVQELRAIATSAVREASNGGTFVDLVHEAAYIKLDVISGLEEARLAYESVQHAFELRSLNAAVIDVGGGSTEIVVSIKGVVEDIVSIPIGAVVVTDRFGLREEGGNPQGYEAMVEYLDAELKKVLRKPPAPIDVVIGCGGSFTALANICLRRDLDAAQGAPPASIRGFEIQRAELRGRIDWIRAMPARQRARIPGLRADRADIILGGLSVIDRVMRRLKVKRLRVHDRGIRDGVIRRMLPDGRGAGSRVAPMLKRDAALRLAKSCRYEKSHCDHVAKLALSIFDQTRAQDPRADEGWATDETRELLEAAALLHDIGYLVNYKRHHKHSYHLVAHSELEGFTHRELEIVANVCRYHRRSCPKPTHEEFARLPSKDRKIVSALGGILRIADGLDRTHTQSVTGVSVRLHGDTAIFDIDCEDDPSVNLWGGENKADLYERFFGINISQWEHTGRRPGADPVNPDGRKPAP
ncbi:MAG: Ppx/GppA family phosphatase [Phycisphaeraceae bacterium]|nr:Ppx/GppA family phosphatase [Phycisphaeraceae bacterium]MCB9847741.1 Ppx/GppA family phosphatase [Phycisphaeraceae bacterium]